MLDLKGTPLSRRASSTRPKAQLRVAVDLDGTITEAPASYDELMADIQAGGGFVAVVTGNQDAKDILQTLGVTHFDQLVILPGNHKPEDKATWLVQNHMTMLFDDKKRNCKAARKAAVPVVLRHCLTDIPGVKRSLRFNADQPRDPDGRFAGGGSSESSGKSEIGRLREHSAFLHDYRHIAEPASRATVLWQGTYEGNALCHMAINDQLYGNTFDVKGHMDNDPRFTSSIETFVNQERFLNQEYDSINRDVNAAAKYIISGVASAPASEGVLFRGTSLPQALVESWKEGDNIKFGPSSFTDKSEVADRGRAAGKVHDPNGVPVSFFLEPGAHAFDLNQASEALDKMNEKVVGGTFKVTDVSQIMPGAPYNVWIKQVANI